jgi:transcriptional regulator GlxA family with amidase domain
MESCSGHKNLYERIVNLESTQQRISFIENMILTKARPSHSLVLWSVRQLKQYGGVVSIPQLAAQAGVSQKKLERAFQKAVGVSPKSLARIFQFMKSKELLAHPQAHDLLSVALACGYYDHAHFTKSFKRYTGINPDEFRKNRVVSFLQTQPFNMYYF